jgi:hypothetical protein
MNYRDYRYLYKDLVSNDGYSRRKTWLRIIDEIREDLEYEKIYYNACDGLEIELEFRTVDCFHKNEFSAPSPLFPNGTNQLQLPGRGQEDPGKPFPVLLGRNAVE